jgi:hypothetical protein
MPRIHDLIVGLNFNSESSKKIKDIPHTFFNSSVANNSNRRLEPIYMRFGGIKKQEHHEAEFEWPKMPTIKAVVF